jgi:hypothetical protein
MEKMMESHNFKNLEEEVKEFMVKLLCKEMLESVT